MFSLQFRTLSTLYTSCVNHIAGDLLHTAVDVWYLLSLYRTYLRGIELLLQRKLGPQVTERGLGAYSSFFLNAYFCCIEPAFAV
jgi:hypothetical protein